MNGDDYCPKNCTASIDWDCPARSCTEIGGKICQTGCKSGTIATSDSIRCCLGECFKEKTCSGKGGIICTGANYCPENFISASDTNQCCSGPCVKNPETCGEREGEICSAEEYCTGAYINSLDSNRCCPLNCTTKILST